MLAAVQATASLYETVTKYPATFLTAATGIGVLTTAVILLRTSLLETLALSVGGFIGGVLDVGKALIGKTTAKQAENLALKETLTLNIAINQQEITRNALASQRVAEELALIEGKAATIVEQEAEIGLQIRINTLEKERLALVAEQNGLKSQQTVSSVGGVVGGISKVLGVVGIIATVGTLVYTAYTYYKESEKALKELDKLDVNSAISNAQKIKELTQAKNDLSAIYNDSSKTATQIKEKELEVSKLINSEFRVGLNLQEGTTSNKEKLLSLIDLQIDKQQKLNDLQKDVAIKNVSTANQNFEKVRQSAQNVADVTNLLTQAQSVLKARGIAPTAQITESYFHANPKSAIEAGIVPTKPGQDRLASYITDSVSQADVELVNKAADATQQLNGFEVKRLQVLQQTLDLSRTYGAEAIKKMEEQHAFLVSSVNDLRQVALNYGMTTKELLDSRLTISKDDQKLIERSKDATVVLTDAERARLEIVQKTSQEYYGMLGIINEILAKENKANTSKALSDVTPTSERFQSLLGEYNTDKTKAIADNILNLQNEAVKLREKGGLTEDQVNQRVADATKRFEDNYPSTYFKGQFGEEKKKALQSVVTQELFNAQKAQKETLTLVQQNEIIKKTYEDLGKIISKDNPNIKGEDLINVLLNQKDTWDTLSKSVENYGQNVTDAVKAADESKETLKLLFSDTKLGKAEEDKAATDQQISDIKTIRKLQYDLGKGVKLDPNLLNNPELIKKTTAELQRQKKVQDDIYNAKARLSELSKGENSELVSLNRQIKIEEAVLNEKKKQQNVEDDIAVLKRTSILPAIDAQLLSEKALLTIAQERKQTQQQLISDITVELVKRKQLNELSYSSLATTQAEVYLDRTKGQGTALKDLAKSYFNLQADLGDQSFRNNPLIKQGEQNAKKMEESVKQADIQILATRRTNEILESSIASRLDQANSNSVALGNTMVSNTQALLDALSGLGNAIQSAVSSNLSFNGKANAGDWWTPERTGQAVNFLKSNAGLSDIGAKGLVARWAGVEAGGGPGSVNPSSGAVGIAQWLGNRKSGTPNDFLGQLRKAANELNSSERAAGNRLRKARTAQDAAIGASMYERAEGYNPSTGIDNFTAKTLAVMSSMNVAVPSTSLEGVSTNPLSSATLAPFKSGNLVKDGNKVNTQLSKLLAKQEEERNSVQEAQARLIDELTNKGLVGNITTIAQSITEIQNQASPNDVNKLENINKILESDDFGVSVSRLVDVGNGVSGMVTQVISLRDQIRANKIGEAFQKERQRRNERSLYGVNLQALNVGFGIRELGDLGGNATGYLNATAGYANSDAFNGLSDASKENILAYYQKVIDGAKERQKQLEILNQKEANSELYWLEVREKAQQDFEIAQKTKDQELDAREENLRIRRAEASKQGSLYNINLVREEITARDEAREAVEDEIRALDRYDKTFRRTRQYQIDLEKSAERDRKKNRGAVEDEIANLEIGDKYRKTLQYRKDLEREALRDRLKAHGETLDQIAKLEIDTANVREGLEDRLRLKKAEISNAEAREYEETLKRQIELERQYKRKSDPLNVDELRNKGLEKINSAMKSQTDLMSELFNSSFDSISNGFGGLIDKMTSKMGLFGGVLGGFLKGIGNNILGGLFKDLLDTIAPGNSILGGLTGSSNDPQSNVASGMSALSDTTIMLNQAFAGLASTLVAIAQGGGGVATATGVAAQAMVDIGSIATAGIGAMMASVRGGTKSSGTLGNIFGSIGNIASRTNSGIGSATSGIASSIGDLGSLVTPILSSQTTSGSGGKGNIFAGTIYRAGTSSSSGGSGGSATGGSFLSTLFSKGGIKSIGLNLLNSAPMIGAGLGGMLGGGTGLSGGLGQIGGLLGGVAGLGLASSLGAFGAAGSSLFAAGGLMAGIFGTGASAGVAGTGIAGALGVSTALASTLVLAPIAGALLVGAYFLNRNKKRRANEIKRDAFMTSSLQQLQDLLKGVRTDKVDGADAVAQASTIRDEYLKQANALDDKKTRGIAVKDVSRLDVIIAQINQASEAQTKRRELNDLITPTYATGGISNKNQWIRVSRGETLFSPALSDTMYSAFEGAGIPGIGNNGSSSSNGAFASGGIVTMAGAFDGKDDILVNVPKGTVIATPRQTRKIATGSYNRGGVAGQVSATAAQGQTVVQPPAVNVTAIVVFSKEEAERVAAQVPDAVIIDKVRTHIRKTGQSGIAGDVINSFE